ncbi:MAG: hypothetical protein AAGA61_08390, partial [Pseudomonadota bacterium]
MKMQIGTSASVILLLGAASAYADDDLFRITELPVDGRVVTATFGDFDGDGRADLMTATIAGMPPAEDRQVQIFLQRPDGSFPAAPDRRM